MLKTNHFIFFIILFFLSFNYSKAQSKEYIAIIPPFHSLQDGESVESSLQLSSKRFIVFVYSNAVAVYSESDFVNQSDDTIEQEFVLPSTGHNENEIEPDAKVSNGILDVHIWVDGEQIEPQFSQNEDEELYSIKAKFNPHENRKVKALFWAETSLTDIDSLPGFDTTIINNGKRSFLINLGHAAAWNGIIQSIDVKIVLKDSILPNAQTFNAVPKTYELDDDSTLTWYLKYVEPSERDNIFVSYYSTKTDSTMNTMSKISEFMVKHSYHQLLDFVDQLEEQ